MNYNWYNSDCNDSRSPIPYKRHVLPNFFKNYFDSSVLCRATAAGRWSRNHVPASRIRKSANSQNVSIVLPSMRPSAPPMSHIRANAEYAASDSIYVYFSSEKNTFSEKNKRRHYSVTLSKQIRYNQY